MSMSASSKKPIPLSAYDRSRLDTTTRARVAEKVLDASNHIPTSDTETAKILDPPTMPDECKLAQRATRVITFFNMGITLFIFHMQKKY